jgi:hypothetical protein
MVCWVCKFMLFDKLHLLQAGAVCSVLFLLSYTWVHVQLLLVHACLIWDRHV